MAEKIVITVASKTAKEKGGFDITDSVGGKYTVSLQNALIADSLIVGRASEVGVASTTYGKYINSAQLFDEEPARPQQPKVEKEAPKPQVVSVKPTVETKYKADPAKTASIERQKALDISKDWAITLLQSGKKDLSGTNILQLAKVFENYLNTGEIPDSALVKEAKKLATETGKES